VLKPEANEPLRKHTSINPPEMNTAHVYIRVSADCRSSACAVGTEEYENQTLSTPHMENTIEAMVAIVV
jgi:hypothetical protein